MAEKKLIVIGGGAAGFFCAVNAARLNPLLKVIVIEKSNKLLSKVKVSGGGRCNVTHACFDIGEMSRNYPRGANFVKKTFHHFFTTDTIKWFDERGVTLKTEEDGRMFPVSNTSETIIRCILKEASTYNVAIMLNAEVKKLEKTQEKFHVELSDHRQLNADYVCVASGGYPKSSMFDWLKETGHTIEEPVPSLFTFNLPGHPIRELMGISAENVKVKIQQSKLAESGAVLITHWGLSGPVVLKLSAWGARELAKLNYEFTISINWLPELNEQTLKERFLQIRNENASQRIKGRNMHGLPGRLWEFLAMQSGVTETMRWAEMPSVVQNKFIKHLCNYELQVTGKTTFKEEFVTAGGIKLYEIDHNTMMSKKVSNLYFAGEIIDVDGVTGGFNFQHAWTSGFIAAKSIAAG
ncbi:MAG TPA: NAD(P)/FAD-dependent oxidoreductase [Chitinophagaceae bacterium]|nr:NAD(P)/FAD-dependent oxidoreductase [Chitinophagaceae bacterium]HRF16858.1 NAD(P)/FAD-dependent oxidoreductase [Chitinophagaceae bacterium]